MAGFVLDVSACMPWCCEDEATPVSERLLQRAAQREALHVPSLWPWEMMNDFAALSLLASRHQLTAYDASYLGLARQLALPIATLDDDLRKAALAEGLDIL